MSIVEGLRRISTEYLTARSQPLRDHPLALFIRDTFPAEVERVVNAEREARLLTQGTKLPGNWADVPWIGVMDPRLTDSIQRGIYVVYVFSADMKSVYLGLGMGVQGMQRQTRETWLRQLQAGFTPPPGFSPGPLQARTLADRGLGKRYERAVVYFKRYSTESLPEEQEANEDLVAISDLLRNVGDSGQYRTDTVASAPELATFTIQGQQFQFSAHDVETAFEATNESRRTGRPGVEPYWYVIVGDQSKSVKAVFRNMRGLPEGFTFTTHEAARVFERLDFEVMNTRGPEDRPRDLCLLGTWKSIDEQDAERVRNAIESKGGWASWWSFPIREEFHAQLDEPFYIYLNSGGENIPYRMRVTKYRTSHGNDGIESPWPEITDPDWVRVSRTGPRNSEICKTWLHVTDVEALEPALTLEDFEPASGVLRTALLNRSAFGYAYRRAPAIVTLEPMLASADLGEASRSFAAELRGAFVEFGSAHDSLVSAFMASIVTKPLVILTGLSGSGKTQIALRFGEWLGEDRLHVAAVRPDWTGAEALFGYEDGLKPAVDGRAAWVVTPPLEFMLEASAAPNYPHLLLLDEMNLAHVERYFADVLSGMESGQPCLPNLVKGADGAWRVRAQGPDRISFPRNVWIVGTVNVDETTYMFSPKVLDRANTFEFRVATSDLRIDVQKPVPCRPGDPALVRGLLTISRDDAWQGTNPASFQNELAEELRRLHLLLARYSMEFGHRVLYESLRFAALAEKAGLASLEDALDRVIMQKVLPRLHGARRRLELPVLALMQFSRDLPDEVAPDEKLLTLQLEVIGDSEPRLPISFEKLSRMLRNLRTNQFTSFTE